MLLLFCGYNYPGSLNFLGMTVEKSIKINTSSVMVVRTDSLNVSGLNQEIMALKITQRKKIQYA
jgi:hypothetical protein